MAECEFQPDSAARFDPDSEVSLVIGEDRFKLGIAFTLMGVVLCGETLSPVRLGGIVLVLIGIVALKLAPT